MIILNTYKVKEPENVIVYKVSGADKTNIIKVSTGAQGPAGEDGEDGEDGVGVPEGGTSGQVLTKASSTDYDTYWADPQGGGGTSNYENLLNKPKINSVELKGNKSLEDFGIASISSLNSKQDTISDLETIRSNASSGASKVSCTESQVSSYGFTKNTGTITGITMNGSSKGTSGVVDLGTVITDISGKQDTISDLETIRSNASSGASKISCTEAQVSSYGFTKNDGTITGITMNGASKGTSGVVDLGTVITDISGKQDIITSTNLLSSDLVDDTNKTHQFVSSSEKTTWNGKSTVSVSSTGTATDEVSYITIDGTEKKLAGGSSSGVSSVNGFTGAVTLYTSGTTDLTEGVSPLDTGKLYFVYEED